MAVIETKFSVGDAVWHAGTTTEAKQHPCPDCKGEKKWKVISPAGGEYTTACPRCSAFFNSDREMMLTYTAHVASVRRLTIGSIQYNSHPGSYDHGARYMCVETGVGGGSVYDEGRLFATEDEARVAAELIASNANSEVEWIAKLYNKTLEISDYQLESAALKVAKDERSRASSLLYNLSDLFEAIEEADDKDAILEAVDEYKKYTWERDKREAAQGIEAPSGGETGTGSTVGESPVGNADAPLTPRP